LAQVPTEEELLRQLGMGGTFAVGNLAVRDLQRGLDPVQQFKRFFAEAKLPLSSDQEKKLSALVDSHVAAMIESGNNEQKIQQLNAEYNRKITELLTPQQRAELRRYRTEQIMMSGGYEALKLVLENAQTPFSPDQERSVRTIYLDFDKQVDELPKPAKGATNRADLDRLENAALGKVVRLLTPAQRKALAASRQGTISSKVRP
jgi:Spy/CpxP family protein refolding chaperone